MNGLALCAGGGGLEFGLHIAIPEYRTVCYVEREAYATSVIVARMAEKTLCEAPVWDDLTTFDGKPWRGLVDIISAGEPCQPFSHAGQRKGTDDERYLFPEVARIISEVEPEFVFLENVAGAVDIRYEHKAVLESMGYRVEAGLFSAAEVGAPHGRLRVFLLANNPGRRLPRSRDYARKRSDSPNASGGELAHTYGTGQGGERRGGVSGNEDSPCGSHADRCDLPLFPPRPNDLEAWRDILQCWPELEPAVAVSKDGQDGQVGVEHEKCNGKRTEVEPAVCGMADGNSYRVERLQLLGNGVVPLTVALAFRTLLGRLQAQP